MKFRISFTFVLTLLTIILSLVPALIIWVVFMDLMTSSVDLLKGNTQNATESMAGRIEGLLMSEALRKFNSRLTEGDTELLAQSAMIQASGLLNFDLRPSRFDIQRQFLTPQYSRNFGTMKGHPFFSSITVVGAIRRNGTDTVASRSFWLNWLALYVDIATQTLGNRTLYAGTLAMSLDEQTATLNSTYVNQSTAAPLILLSNQTVPFSSLVMLFAPSGWDTTLGFSSFSGQVLLTKWQWLPAQNNTWIQVSLSISANTISDELKAQLSDYPLDRLVLFFRQPHGYMIGASHGKFYSHSDVDRRYINPLTSPPNISAYRLWTCLQSTDTLIQQACQWLFGEYGSWVAIPEVREDAVLGGEQYWVAVEHSTSSLQSTVLMLKNRASVMGNIDAGNTQVDQSMEDKKGITFVVLGVVSVAAALFPLVLGMWLSNRMHRLASGMDRIAKLQFSANSLPPTIFQELHRFQTSFIQMERGLQAFGKFVPQAVVKVLVAGEMKATDEMHFETLTMMFADIEGFSTICENVSPQVLVRVCTEYFEAMCSNVTQHGGTIDKFIGDCIMAIWNAPERLPGHEKDAVAASLAMQDSLMRLHSSWHRQGLPLLKFRLGIHTAVCLVGNFGCIYRVSYTCLGDGVNLAARLEALNKKFGTYICVSHATYQACRGDFHFRKLGRVTVPGKAEVLPVYEVLCDADGLESSARTMDLPGAVRQDDASDMLSTGSASDAGAREVQSPTTKSTSSASSAVETPLLNQVPYHWAYVNQARLLRQAREYEEVYEAMVVGDYAYARKLLAEPLLDVPDKAWAMVGTQLEHTDPGQPWDGVFYFREK